MRKFFAIFILLFVFSFLYSEETWEGNAAVVVNASLDEKGLYALSNSFPRYSKVEVTNLETGKSVSVTVIGRIDGSSSMFILLSREAASRLGMERTSISPVKVTISHEPGVVSEGLPDDLPYNPDPDINPAVNIPHEENVKEKAVKEVKKEIVRGKVEKPVKENVEKKAEEKKEEKAKEISEEPKKKIQEKTIKPEEQFIQALSSRKPQKKLFHAPAETGNLIVVEKPEKPKEKFAPIKIEELPKATDEKSILPSEEYIAKPDIERTKAEKAPIFSLPNLEVPSLEESANEKAENLVSEETLSPKAKPEIEAPGSREEKTMASTPGLEKEAPPKGKIIVKLEPTTPKPPPPVVKNTEGGTEIKKQSTVKAKGTRTVELKKGAYYLQLAAYSSEALAENLVKNLSSSYPVTVLSTRKKNRIFYRVLVGPLASDESGALLYWFRSNGYKDSFIRKTD